MSNRGGYDTGNESGMETEISLIKRMNTNDTNASTRSIEPGSVPSRREGSKGELGKGTRKKKGQRDANKNGSPSTLSSPAGEGESGMETELSQLKRMATGESSTRSIEDTRFRAPSTRGGVTEGATDAEDLPSDSSAATFVTRKSSFFAFTKKKAAAEEHKAERNGTSPGLPQAPKQQMPIPVSSLGQPCILLTPYGTDWALDLFALPQNAIRYEIDSLYTILIGIGQKHTSMSKMDLERLQRWLTMFRSFIEKYLNVQEILIYPWIQRESTPLVGELSVQRRRESHDKILNLLQIVYDTPKTAPSRLPPHLLFKVYPTLRRQVDELVGALATHFGAVEHTLPPLLKRLYDEKDSKNMRQDMVDAFNTNPYKREHVVLLAKWMQQPDYKEMYRQWKAENIRGTRAVGYSEWETLYDRNHACIVRKFHKQLYPTGRK